MNTPTNYSSSGLRVYHSARPPSSNLNSLVCLESSCKLNLKLNKTNFCRSSSPVYQRRGRPLSLQRRWSNRRGNILRPRPPPRSQLHQRWLQNELQQQRTGLGRWRRRGWGRRVADENVRKVSGSGYRGLPGGWVDFWNWTELHFEFIFAAEMISENVNYGNFQFANCFSIIIMKTSDPLAEVA